MICAAGMLEKVEKEAEELEVVIRNVVTAMALNSFATHPEYGELLFWEHGTLTRKLEMKEQQIAFLIKSTVIEAQQQASHRPAQ